MVTQQLEQFVWRLIYILQQNIVRKVQIIPDPFLVFF